MKKLFVLVCMTVVIALLAGNVMADSIRGRTGLTARGGFQVPVDSKFQPDTGIDIDGQTGWAAGGGFIFGVTDNMALTLDATYARYDLEVSGVKTFEARTVDASVGLQYRFNPQLRVVPYAEIGVDVFFNDIENRTGLIGDLDTDESFGGHVSAGFDIFLSRQAALTAEIRGVLASEADVKDFTGFAGARFDPSNVSGLFGLRLFF